MDLWHWVVCYQDMVVTDCHLIVFVSLFLISEYTSRVEAVHVFDDMPCPFARAQLTLILCANILNIFHHPPPKELNHLHIIITPLDSITAVLASLLCLALDPGRRAVSRAIPIALRSPNPNAKCPHHVLE